MRFEFNLPLQALRKSFMRATSRYVDEPAAISGRRVAFPPKRDSCALVSNLQASEQLGRVNVACEGNTGSLR